MCGSLLHYFLSYNKKVENIGGSTERLFDIVEAFSFMSIVANDLASCAVYTLVIIVCIIVGERMMADAEEVRMLAEITRLYYEEEWIRQRIAKKFNMSRSLVSKLLSKARKLSTVKYVAMTAGTTTRQIAESGRIGGRTVGDPGQCGV